MTAPVMTLTLQQLYRQTRRRLGEVTASTEQAGLEAVLLMENALGVRADDIHVKGDALASEKGLIALEHLLRERIERRIPVQYLLHRSGFYGLSFYVNPHVLIPRPETEHLVEAALQAVRAMDPSPVPAVLDVGTGSGAIAIALSHTLNDRAEISAVDVSPDALRVAGFNQRLLGSSVRFRMAGDLFSPLEPGERFDVIVSNPPYVDPALQSALMPEVLWHEPASALFPPADDIYCFYRRLASEGRARLRPGGRLMVEVGAGMAETVGTIFRENGFLSVKSIPDYAGIERVVCGMVPQFARGGHS